MHEQFWFGSTSPLKFLERTKFKSNKFCKVSFSEVLDGTKKTLSSEDATYMTKKVLKGHDKKGSQGPFFVRVCK